LTPPVSRFRSVCRQGVRLAGPVDHMLRVTEFGLYEPFSTSIKGAESDAIDIHFWSSTSTNNISKYQKQL
jgi:hypothetical protein